MRGCAEHLVVHAGAGCGKTTTELEGIKHLPCGQIVMTAFNRDICNELETRVPPGRGIRVNTLHSIGRSMVELYLRPSDTRINHFKTHDHIRAALKARRPV